jgi:imidazolonepropionase-like amidohydrolase
MTPSYRTALRLVAVLGLASGCSIAVTASAQEAVVVRGARIYTVTHGVIESGTLVCEAGKITGVGPTAQVRIPPGAQVIDASGKTVMPGIVESHTHVGMKRLWVPADLDNNELSGPINAQLRGLDSIDTRDRAFKIALEAGVTTMNVSPGSQTPNGGEAVMLKLRGGTVDDMYLATGGMKFALRTTFRERRIYPTTHMGVASILREKLVAAQDYKKAWDEYTASGKQGPPPARDLQLEALVKVLTREWMVGAHAQPALEMLNIIRIAKEFNLDLFIIHGTSLVDVVDEVVAAKIPISFGPGLPGIGRESRVLLGPVRLVQRGGKVAFHQDHPDGPQLYLRHFAALFVAQGMPEAEALKALTINPAELFRLDKRIGSLEVGKDADFLIMSGGPLEIDTHVERVFVEGKEVYNRATGRSVF